MKAVCVDVLWLRALHNDLLRVCIEEWKERAEVPKVGFGSFVSSVP